MSWEEVQLGELLAESRIPADNPDPNRRIRVKLHVEGVEKRPLENEMEGATKQFIRRAGQFIYGKQNFHKGAFGIVPDELDGFETSADIPSFDVREDCLPEWIYYFFKSGNRYLQLEKLARGVGSQRIHPKQIYDIAIPLPPKEKQWELIQDIINTESKFYDFAGEQSIQLDLLKKLRQQILQDAVKGKLVPQDPNDEPASKLLERIKAEKEKLVKEKKIKKEKSLPPINPKEVPFEIPENWIWCRISDILSYANDAIRRGPFGSSITKNMFVPKSTSATKVYEQRNAIYKDYTLGNYFIDLQQHPNLNSFLAGAGDIIVSCAGTIGETYLLPNNAPNGIINQALLKIRLNGNIMLNHYFMLFFKATLKGRVNLDAKGSAMKNLGSIGYLKEKLYIPLPTLNEQMRILTKIEQLMTLCNELEHSIQQNQKYTQELLQVALKEALEPKLN